MLEWASFVTATGQEPGMVVNLFSSPRLVRTPKQIRRLALELAEILRLKFNQQRVYVMVGGDTILVGEK